MATQSEIEAAAAAMWENHITDNHVFGGPNQADPWSSFSEDNKAAYYELARVALEAAERVRSPAEAMRLYTVDGINTRMRHAGQVELSKAPANSLSDESAGRETAEQVFMAMCRAAPRKAEVA